MGITCLECRYKPPAEQTDKAALLPNPAPETENKDDNIHYRQ